MSLPFTLLLDPAQPETLFPPPVQLLVAANTIQRGQRESVEQASMGHGYGLRINDDLEIHSFPTLTGETLRMGIQQRGGVAMLRQLHQFIPDGNYQWQPGIRNTTTGDTSDRLHHDGIRSRFNCIPLDDDDPIGFSNSFGDGSAPTVILATIFEVPEWVAANDLNACILGEHAPTDGPASPFTSFLGQGSWRIVHRNSRTPLKARSAAPRGEFVGEEVKVTAEDVGERWAVVIEAVHDPIVGTFRAWLYRRGRWETVADVEGGWGGGYAPTDPDRNRWYAILKGFYSWKRANSSVAPYNWDNRFLTRELCYGPSALFVDEEVTAKQVGDWLVERLEPAPRPEPPQPPDDPRYRALEARVAALETDAARQRMSWSQIADIALKAGRAATDT